MDAREIVLQRNAKGWIRQYGCTVGFLGIWENWPQKQIHNGFDCS